MMEKGMGLPPVKYKMVLGTKNKCSATPQKYISVVVSWSRI